MAIAKMIGSGWHSQSIRHSNARRFGRAGGQYAYWNIDKKGKYDNYVPDITETRKRGIGIWTDIKTGEHKLASEVAIGKGYLKKGDFVVYKTANGTEYVAEVKDYPYVNLIGTSFQMPVQEVSGSIIRLASKEDIEKEIRLNLSARKLDTLEKGEKQRVLEQFKRAKQQSKHNRFLEKENRKFGKPTSQQLEQDGELVSDAPFDEDFQSNVGSEKIYKFNGKLYQVLEYLDNRLGKQGKIIVRKI